MFACDNCLWNDFGLSANGSEVLKMLKNWFCHARNRVVPGGNRFPLNPKLLILWFLVPGTGLSLGGNRFLRCFCPLVCVPGTGLSLGGNRFPAVLKYACPCVLVPGTGLSLGGNRFLCVIFVFFFS